jgi:hypothetical protein
MNVERIKRKAIASPQTLSQEDHKQILDHYRRLTPHWWDLENDGYIHTYLVWHLEQTDRGDEIHEVLAAITADGQNAWYRACERSGNFVQFTHDLYRAWQLADRLQQTEPHRAITLQIRYALMASTLEFMFEDAPPIVLAALVERGFYSRDQIWTHIASIAHQKNSNWINCTITCATIFDDLEPALAIIRSQPNDFIETIARQQAHRSEWHPLSYTLETALSRQPGSPDRNLALESQALERVKQQLHRRSPVWQNLLAEAFRYWKPEIISEFAKSQSEELFEKFIDWSEAPTTTELDIAHQKSQLDIPAPTTWFSPAVLWEAVQILKREFHEDDDPIAVLVELTAYMPDPFLRRFLNTLKPIDEHGSKYYGRIDEFNFVWHCPIRATADLAARAPQQFSSMLSRSIKFYRKSDQEFNQIKAIAACASYQPELYDLVLDQLRLQMAPIQLEWDFLNEIPHGRSNSLISDRRYRNVSELKPLIEQVPYSRLMTLLEILQPYKADDRLYIKILSCLAQRHSELLPELIAAVEVFEQPNLSRGAQGSLEQRCWEFQKIELFGDLAQSHPVFLPQALQLLFDDIIEPFPHRFAEVMRSFASFRQLRNSGEMPAAEASKHHDQLQSEHSHLHRSAQLAVENLCQLANVYPDLLTQALEAIKILKPNDTHGFHPVAEQLCELANPDRPEVIDLAIASFRDFKPEYPHSWQSIQQKLFTKLLKLRPELLPEAFAAVVPRDINPNQTTWITLKLWYEIAKIQPAYIPVAFQASKIFYQGARNGYDHRINHFGDFLQALSAEQFQAIVKDIEQIADDRTRARFLGYCLPRLTLDIEDQDNWQRMLRTIAHSPRPDILEQITKLLPTIHQRFGSSAVADIAQIINEVCHQWP